MEESAGARERRGGKERESDRDVRNVEEGRGREGGDGSRCKRDESGRGRTRDGQERPCATKVGTEVVVRNDNTSTDISIIHLRGTLTRHSILRNCRLV